MKLLGDNFYLINESVSFISAIVCISNREWFVSCFAFTLSSMYSNETLSKKKKSLESRLDFGSSTINLALDHHKNVCHYFDDLFIACRAIWIFEMWFGRSNVVNNHENVIPKSVMNENRLTKMIVKKRKDIFQKSTHIHNMWCLALIELSSLKMISTINWTKFSITSTWMANISSAPNLLTT